MLLREGSTNRILNFDTTRSSGKDKTLGTRLGYVTGFYLRAHGENNILRMNVRMCKILFSLLIPANIFFLVNSTQKAKNDVIDTFAGEDNAIVKCSSHVSQ